MIKRIWGMRGKLFLVLTLVFVLPFMSAVNLGISPASLNFEDVMRGGHSEDYMTVTVDSVDSIEVEFESTGEIKDWINFSENHFLISKDNPGKIKVSINPPTDIPNGNYTGFLKVTTGVFEEGKEGHATGKIKSTLDLIIDVEITDVEYINCVARNFVVNSPEQGDDLIFEMDIENLGNVRISPMVLMDVWDKDQSMIVKNNEFISKEILPTSSSHISFRVETDDLEAAQYWSEIYAVECLDKDLLTFDILDEGSLTAKGTILSIVTKKESEVGETIPIEIGFRNTGEKEVSARFVGQVSQAGKIVKVLESENIIVPIDSNEKFNFYFKSTEEGKYVISGRVIYDSKKTFEKSEVIEVVSSGINSTKYAYFVFVIIIGMLLYNIHKEKNKYKNKLRSIK